MPISPYACPGPCNKQARADWDAYDAAIALWLGMPAHQRWDKPEQPDIVVNVGTPVWDGDCVRMIRRAFAELDDLASVLAADIDGYRGAAIVGPNGTKPLDHKQVVDTLDELFGALVDVEDNWREFRGYEERSRRARGGHARRLSIKFLSTELDDILLHPGSVQFGLATLAWQRRLRKHTKSDPARSLSAIRCPSCKEIQVRRKANGDYECACGQILKESEHDREVDEQADEFDRQEVGAS